MQTDTETIIDRIRKLYALAEHSSTNAAEAANAAAKAADLLARYNIDRAALDARKGTKSTAIALKTIRMSTRNHWAKYLFNVVALANFCKYIYASHSKENAAWVIGEAHNIEATLEMVRYLESQLAMMQSAAYIQYKQNRKTGTSYASALTFKTNFMLAATHTINKRLTEARAELIREQEEEAAQHLSQNRALMVIDANEAAIREFLTEKTNFKIENPRLRTHTANNDGYLEGHQAGESVDLGQQKRLY